ncbi:SAM domain-containing protein, partial [Planctomycetota bacterium]|nr:SAM domain-containing protein [Planctomycetota bacterium]
MGEPAADLPALLQSLGLEAYLPNLADEGVDDLETLGDLSESELADLGFKLGHRKKLLRGLRERGAAPRLSETAERVIARYPYPIALPLSELAELSDVKSRASVVTAVFREVLKYQALILQSEYLLSDRIDEDLNRILQKDLLRPLDSVWIKLVETAIAGMESDGATAFAPELIDAYGEAETHRKRADQVETPGQGYHDDSGEFVPTTARLGLVRALLRYRNKDVAHGGRTKDAARERLEFFMEVLEELLDTFSWMSRYTLLKREDGQVWRMMGAAPEPIDHPWPHHLNETGLALVAPDGERALPLFPLFVVPRQFVAKVEEGEDLLIYASNTGKRVCYSSPSGHERELKSAMRPWRQLLEAKALALPELTPETLTPAELARRSAVSTRDTEDQLLASRKLLKGVYVSRPDAEVHLRPLPGTAFPLALVTAQAGAGKTTLLHHVAAEWANEGASVLLARANAIEGTDLMAWLREELRLADSVTPDALAAGGASEEHPLVLVLDGLNEHGEREA